MKVQAQHTGNGFYAGKVYDFIEDKNGHFETVNSNGHLRFISRDCVYAGAPCAHFVTEFDHKSKSDCWKIIN